MPVTVTSPFAATVVDLGDLVDPVFAERIVGDGVALRPVSTGTITVVAPAAGRISKVFPGGHGIAIETEAGAMLVHIGIDTVQLEGKGFRTVAEQDATVAAGDPLVVVDLAAVAAAGYDPVTPILAIAGQEIVPIAPAGASVEVGDPLFRLP